MTNILNKQEKKVIKSIVRGEYSPVNGKPFKWDDIKPVVVSLYQKGWITNYVENPAYPIGLSDEAKSFIAMNPKLKTDTPEEKKYRSTKAISIIALCIAICSLGVSVWNLIM